MFFLPVNHHPIPKKRTPNRPLNPGHSSTWSPPSHSRHAPGARRRGPGASPAAALRALRSAVARLQKKLFTGGVRLGWVVLYVLCYVRLFWMCLFVVLDSLELQLGISWIFAPKFILK